MNKLTFWHEQLFNSQRCIAKHFIGTYIDGPSSRIDNQYLIADLLLC